MCLPEKYSLGHVKFNIIRKSINISPFINQSCIYSTAVFSGITCCLYHGSLHLRNVHFLSIRLKLFSLPEMHRRVPIAFECSCVNFQMCYFFLVLLRINWHTTHVNWRCKIRWFHTHVYDFTYSMVITVNNAVFYTQKLLRE